MQFNSPSIHHNLYIDPNADIQAHCPNSCKPFPHITLKWMLRPIGRLQIKLRQGILHAKIVLLQPPDKVQEDLSVAVHHDKSALFRSLRVHRAQNFGFVLPWPKPNRGARRSAVLAYHPSLEALHICRTTDVGSAYKIW